tara:strand:+ start:1297 stop:1500 length:204 start_codon:yes stop_codon:yes gene_type:complete
MSATAALFRQSDIFRSAFRDWVEATGAMEKVVAEFTSTTAGREARTAWEVRREHETPQMFPDLKEPL